MANVFSEIVNMSVSACWIILIVMLLRIVFRKAPKWVNCLLWGIAGWRLIIPFSFESAVSLVPFPELVSDEVLQAYSGADVSGAEILKHVGNNQVNYNLGLGRDGLSFLEMSSPDGVDVVNPLLLNTYIGGIVWLIGIGVLLLYTLISFIRLKRKSFK